MLSDAEKWMRISQKVMQAGVSQCFRDGLACKSKWNLIVSEYKHIADFLACSGTNDLSYWHLTAVEKKVEGLSRTFAEDIFFLIHDWYGRKPAIIPVRTCDSLVPDDSHGATSDVEPASTHNDGGSDDDDEEPAVDVDPAADDKVSA